MKRHQLCLDDPPGEPGIGHFCHTPWAPPDYYRMLPDEVGRALLDGILGADRAGFHAERWATAFMDCCAAASEGANIVIMNRKSRIRVMPSPHTRRVAMVKCSVCNGY